MGWVKFTAKAAAAPPQAMDSMRVGLRVVAIDMVRGNSYCLIFDEWRNVIAKTMTLPEVGWLTTQDAGEWGRRDSVTKWCGHVREFRRFAKMILQKNEVGVRHHGDHG